MRASSRTNVQRAHLCATRGWRSLPRQQDLQKVLSGKAPSPLLLVRMPKPAKVIIADGYHRLCAVYALDEDAVIRCKIV